MTASLPQAAGEKHAACAVVFVVDDEALVRRALLRALRDGARELHGFEHPVAALAEIDRLRPELVVSDNQMPHVSGVDFLRHLRAARPEIRTLMVTGGEIGGDIRAAVAAGAIDRLLAKPWREAELRAAVCELLCG
ncbi:MAG: response regulator [Deltaproteobacteria bacterium]|nr:response regulator [Deltaproteobacteria bacterium]